MSIKIGEEHLLTYGEAAKLLPKGSRPSYSTFWRWCNRGIRGVKLETVLVGGKRFTTAAAMQRFCDALSSPIQPTSAKFRSGGERRRQDESVEAELRRARVL